MSDPTRYDVAIVGGGHNGLVAAAYLARFGYRVLVLERLSSVGGAAVSESPWPGVDARLSRYSYLVSLLPPSIISDLNLSLTLRRRRISSYTPDPADPTRGILVDSADADATSASFARTTGDSDEAARFETFYDRLLPLARRIFATVTQPLPREAEVATGLDRALWDSLTRAPLGDLIGAELSTDLARGIALTDGLIGTFARSDDASLAQNRCFLYHVIGGGTGDWDVPVGGMGAVTGALGAAARDAGVEIRTGRTVVAISPDGEVETDAGERIAARLVLSGVGPAVLDDLLRAGGTSVDDHLEPEGSQLKVNMLLSRLPRLKDDAVSSEAAFAGTFHINETFTGLDAAYDQAAAGAIPDPLPAEVYCHSLTDPSILEPELRRSGAQTLTLFGVHVPHRLMTGDPNVLRDTLQAAALRSLDSVLAEPIADCIAVSPSGEPCIETRTTRDLDASLAMRGGNIFHGDLSWPWASDAEPLDHPAARWGVATGLPNVLLCGSGARRGGAVSGIGGHNAAMAAREILG